MQHDTFENTVVKVYTDALAKIVQFGEGSCIDKMNHRMFVTMKQAAWSIALLDFDKLDADLEYILEPACVSIKQCSEGEVKKMREVLRSAGWRAIELDW